MSRLLNVTVALAAAGLLCVGCNNMPWSKKDKSQPMHNHDNMSTMPTTQTAMMMADTSTGGGDKPQATANIRGAGDNKKIKGTVGFTQEGDSVRVVADIDGLAPGKHGIHIHEKTDLSAPDLKSAGPHWNPDGHKHGGPDTDAHHAGDLGNITADDNGHGHLEEVIKGISVTGANGVVNHSVIIHAKEDDMKTDPAGNSGDRIAGGVIEVRRSSGKS